MMQYRSKAKQAIYKILTDGLFIDRDMNPIPVKKISIKDINNVELSEIFKGMLDDESFNIGDSDVFNGEYLTENLFISLLLSRNSLPIFETNDIDDFIDFVISIFSKEIDCLIDEVVEDIEDSALEPDNTEKELDQQHRIEDMRG